MAIPVITLVNQTVSAIELSQLGLVVPGSGSIPATGPSGSVSVSDVLNDPELHSEVDAGNVTLQIDAVSLSVDQSQVWLDPQRELAALKHNFTATSAPTVSDDETAGYSVGSFWGDNTGGVFYRCFDASAGVAVWTTLAKTGVDVTAHAVRHLPSGADPLATAAAIAITDSTNGAGSAESFSRSDHTHAHGARGGGTLHAAATTSVAGFISAADKTKLDGVATGATNTPLTNTVPVNVTKATAVVGVSTEAARQDHKHDITTGVAVDATVGQANAEGTGTTLARSTHTHAHAVGTPVTITDSTNAAGAATTFVRSDHQHAHGNRGGGSLHSVATGSVNGFMSAADKTKLDNITGNASAFSSVFVGPVASTSSGTFVDGLAGSSISPPENGDYLILFNGNMSGSTGNTESAFGISVNSTVTIVADSERFAQGNGKNRIPASTHTIQTGLTTSDVIRVLFRKSGGSGTSSIINRRVSIMKVTNI